MMKKMKAKRTKLDLLRRQIDGLDARIVRLLNRRAATARELGRLKKEQGCPVRVRAREHEVLRRVKKRSAGPMTDRAVVSVYRAIIKACRDVQKI